MVAVVVYEETAAAELELDVEREYQRVTSAAMKAIGAIRPAWVLVAAHAAVGAEESAALLAEIEPDSPRSRRCTLLARRAMRFAELLAEEVES